MFHYIRATVQFSYVRNVSPTGPNAFPPPSPSRGGRVQKPGRTIKSLSGAKQTDGTDNWQTDGQTDTKQTNKGEKLSWKREGGRKSQADRGDARGMCLRDKPHWTRRLLPLSPCSSTLAHRPCQLPTATDLGPWRAPHLQLQTQATDRMNGCHFLLCPGEAGQTGELTGLMATRRAPWLSLEWTFIQTCNKDPSSLCESTNYALNWHW